MNSTAIATIHLSALTHNLLQIKQLLPAQKIMAMIKSNAYGHGLVPVAKAIAVADALGIATIAEALQLRNASVEKELVVMRGFVTTDELSLFLNDSYLVAGIHTIEQVLLLEQYQATDHQKLRIWLKVDTGMHRLGIPAEAFADIYARLMKLSFIQKPFVVCSHLADADNPNQQFTQQQIALFDVITHSISNEKSILNSAGIIAYPESPYDWVRPGLLMYGISPFIHHAYDHIINRFHPAMTLESKLIAIKQVNSGEKIGYSCTFTASRSMRIGIVGMGYGDSYPRHAKNGTPVLIRGERCPIVGRVSMDMITVDVSHLETVAVDDTVILWGEGLPVSEIAQCVNTVPHELICHLTGRVQTVYR